MLADFVTRGGARLWYSKTLADGGTVPYARDAPRARFGEGRTDHVLLLGNGPAHGWGVASHQMALPGQLARAISEKTERAVELEYIGAELMNAESALPWLGDHDLAPYDAVVVVMGMNDAVRRTPVQAWERDMTALLRHLRAGLHHDAPIVVAGIQPVATVPPYRGLYAALGQRRADALDAATRRFVAAMPDVMFVPLGAPELDVSHPYGSVRIYRGWADTLTAAAAPLLDAHHAHALDRRRSKLAKREWSWLGAPALLEAAADRGTPELRRLVNAAKIEFGVSLSVVTLLEGDRMWFAAASADTPVAIPAALSYDRYVPSDEAMVVADASGDQRFRDNPFVTQSHLPFYAGHPVHDLSGRMIGTFCVLSARPRRASSISLVTLESYAQQAERELHRLESEALGAPVGV